jgi:uncharacterized protein
MTRDLPWYSGEGLSFRCTRCGNCCKGPSSGYVWVESHEVNRLSSHLGLSAEDFGRRYLRRVGSRVSLVENRRHDCVFWLDGEGCTVYEERPDQCRQFPFWPEVVESPEAWSEESERCPGLGQGDRYSAEQIASIMESGETRIPRS